MDDLRKRFGRLVAANRKRRGLTQHQLAESAGLSPEMIARIETGATGARFPTIEKLSEALAIDPAELFTPELAAGAVDRAVLTNLVSRLAGLSDSDLLWLTGVIDASLKSRA